MPPKSLNVVRCREDFKKKRPKPGKKLKRLNLTVPVVKCRRLIVAEQAQNRDMPPTAKECLNKLNSPIARVVRDGLAEFSGIDSTRSPELCQVVWSLLCRESSVRKMLIRLLQTNVSAFVGDELNLCAYLHSAWTHRDDSVRNDGLIALDVILGSQENPRLPSLQLLRCLIRSCQVVVQGYSLINRRVERKLQVIKLINGLLRLYQQQQQSSPPADSDTPNVIDLTPARICFIYDQERSSSFQKLKEMIPDILDIVEDDWNSFICSSDCDIKLRGIEQILESVERLTDIVYAHNGQTRQQVDGVVLERLGKIKSTVCVELTYRWSCTLGKAKHQKLLMQLRLCAVRLAAASAHSSEFEAIVCFLIFMLEHEEITTDMQNTISSLLTAKSSYSKTLSSLLRERIIAIASKRNPSSNERIRCLELLKPTEKFSLLCETVSAFLSSNIVDDKLDSLLVMLRKAVCEGLYTTRAADWVLQSHSLPESVQLSLIDSVYLMPLTGECLSKIRTFVAQHANDNTAKATLSALQYRVLHRDGDDLDDFLSFILSMLSGITSEEMDACQSKDQSDIEDMWNEDTEKHERICKLVIRYFGGFPLILNVICDGLYSLLGVFDKYEECLAYVPPTLAIGCACTLPIAPLDSSLQKMDRLLSSECRRQVDSSCIASERLRQIRPL